MSTPEMMALELEVAAAISLRTGGRVNRIEREYSGVAEPRTDLVTRLHGRKRTA
jgi:hypothetical protein